MNTFDECNGNPHNNGDSDSDLGLLTLSVPVFFLLAAISLYREASETKKVCWNLTGLGCDDWSVLGVLDGTPLCYSDRLMCTLEGFYQADLSEEGGGKWSLALC